jgi:hypothetical protein
MDFSNQTTGLSHRIDPRWIGGARGAASSVAAHYRRARRSYRAGVRVVNAYEFAGVAQRKLSSALYAEDRRK